MIREKPPSKRPRKQSKEYCSICLETAFISEEFGTKMLMVVAAAEE